MAQAREEKKKGFRPRGRESLSEPSEMGVAVTTFKEIDKVLKVESIPKPDPTLNEYENVETIKQNIDIRDRIVMTQLDSIYENTVVGEWRDDKEDTTTLTYYPTDRMLIEPWLTNAMQEKCNTRPSAQFETPSGDIPIVGAWIVCRNNSMFYETGMAAV